VRGIIVDAPRGLVLLVCGVQSGAGATYAEVASEEQALLREGVGI